MRTIFIGLLTLLCIGGTAQNYYIAHRGASFDAPENTVASAKLAWEQGADAVEIDVYLASDNRVVVIHDNNTNRVAGNKRNLPIRNTPSLVLRDLDVGSWKGEQWKGERIPYLEEIFETLPENRMLVVEVKCTSEIIPHLQKVMEKSGKAEQVIFICFDWQTIVDLKKTFPENKAYWLSSSKKDVVKKMPEAVEAGLEGVDLHFGIIDQEIMDLAKNHHLEVLAWTVNDPEEAKRLNNLGVTYITTDRPQWLKEQVGK